MKVKLLFLILLLVLWSLSASAQVVTAEPPFPLATEAVVITFHADRGDSGMKGYTGNDLYAHTGVITGTSTGPSDWRYVVADWGVNLPKAKLIRISADTYTLTITPSIREYYDVPAGEEILKLAFVFRNANGSRTGRDAGGNDIFYNVSKEAGFELLFSQPDAYTSLVNPGEEIVVSASASVADSIILFQNGERLARVTETVLDHTITASGTGNFKLLVTAWHNNVSKSDSAYYFIRTAVTTAPVPAGMKPGVNITGDNTALFLLYAPYKTSVFVTGDFNNWIHSSEGFMKRSPDGSWYWLEVTGLDPAVEYGFQYLIDETLRIADPYATRVLDPWNDKYIDDAVYPDLKPYPTGKADNLVSLFQTRPTEYNWENSSFIPPDPDTLIIYEMLVRDFVATHRFSTIRDTLGYLQKLGINALELMPVNEFEGNSSWGYNPAMYFAVDKYYGKADDLKELIDSCHNRGIAVILDIVLNHAYGTNPLVRMYWDSQAGRPAPNNPWFNVTSPNQVYSWGYDFNHESSRTKEFVDSVCHYWISEFRVDGFRFDFTKGFTNKPGDGWAYDASRIAILKRIGDKIWSYKPEAILILEHFTDNQEEKELAEHGFLLWGNAWNRYQAASTSQSGWNMSLKDASWKERGWSGPGMVDYMESHDEERIMHLNLTQGEAVGGYNIRELNTALKRIKLTATFFMTIPGPKMLWQFQELGYDYAKNYNNDPLGPKPIRWDYYSQAARKNLYDNFAALAELKKSEPAFSSANFTLSEAGETKRLNIEHSDMDVVVIGNFDIFPREVDPAFTRTGQWYEFFSGTTLNITEADLSSSLFIQPGEYCIYTSKPVRRPSFLLGVEQPVTGDDCGEAPVVYPNPFTERTTVLLPDEGVTTSRSLELISASGVVIRTIPILPGRDQVEIDGSNLPKGVYYFRVTSAESSSVVKVVRY